MNLKVVRDWFRNKRYTAVVFGYRRYGVFIGKYRTSDGGSRYPTKTKTP